MSQEISREQFVNALFSVIDESFDKVEGVYLDSGTSLFDTINKLSADEASRKVPNGKTTIAGHVDHARFYLRAIENFMLEKPGKVDWSESWQTTTVNAQEWEALKERLKAARDSIVAVMNEFDDWNNPKKLGGAMGIVAHTAFHLGAIRQMIIATKGGRANLGEFETM